MEYVIFLDDEFDLITNCVNLLKKELSVNFITKVFTDSVDCFEFIEQKHDKINYIFIDYSMPEIDGVTFLNEIKQKYSHIKGYILTGWSSKIEEIKSYDTVTDVLGKDVDLEQNILKVLINK